MMNAKKRLALVTMLVTVLLLSACSRGPGDTITTSGTIMGTETQACAEVTGKVSAVLAVEGTRVREGDRLAIIDDSLYQINLKQARAQMAFAEAKLAEAKVGPRPEAIQQADAAAQAALQQAIAAKDSVVQAQKSLEQVSDDTKLMRQLSDMGQGRDTTVDTALRKYQVSQAALDVAKSQATAYEKQAASAQAQASLIKKGFTAEQIAQLEAQLQSASAAVDLAARNLDRTVVKAPVSGTVVRRIVEPGAFATVGTPLVTLVNIDELWLRVYVPTKYMSFVKLGATVEVRVDAYPNRTFKAQVYYISDQAEYTPRNTQTSEERANMVYAVKVRMMEGLSGELKPGMPADVIMKGNVNG
jgi:HlyD family secretion protein